MLAENSSALINIEKTPSTAVIYQYNNNNLALIPENVIYVLMFYLFTCWQFFLLVYNYDINLLYTNYLFSLFKYYNTQFFQIYYI